MVSVFVKMGCTDEKAVPFNKGGYDEPISVCKDRPKASSSGNIKPETFSKLSGNRCDGHCRRCR